jgi:hypothetical protein
MVPAEQAGYGIEERDAMVLSHLDMFSRMRAAAGPSFRRPAEQWGQTAFGTGER